MKDKYINLILIGVLILILFVPFGVPYWFPIPDISYVNFNDTICFGCTGVQDPSILILLSIVIPIVVLISIIVRIFPKKKEMKNLR